MSMAYEGERAKMGDFFQHRNNLYVAVNKGVSSCLKCDAEKKHACLAFPTGCTGSSDGNEYVWIEYLPLKGK